MSVDGQTTVSATVHGLIQPQFEPVRELFADFLSEDPDYAAQFCAYAGGRLIADMWGGPNVAADDIQGVFSATKGVAGVCIALLVQRGVLDFDAPVCRYWPEFASGGKQDITLRVALSHQAGLAGVEPQLRLEDMLDHDAVAARLAAQLPQWRPGAAHGYHALTIGVIMDELVRRTIGVPLAQFFRDEVGGPRAIDFYITTPAELQARVCALLPSRPASVPAAAPRDSPTRRGPDSFFGMALNLAAGVGDTPMLPNLTNVRAAGSPAVSGVGSARALARLYAMCISEVDGLPRLLTEQTVELVTQLQTVGDDLVLGCPTRFGIVFQKPDDRLWFGSHQAFGHDGAGGALGVADPWHDLAYGYIPRRMSVPGGADERGMLLAQQARNCR